MHETRGTTNKQSLEARLQHLEPIGGEGHSDIGLWNVVGFYVVVRNGTVDQLGSERLPSDKHQLQMTDKGAGREAPPIGHAIVSHSPFHRAFEVRQCLGGQGIDTFGDALLRFGKALDVSEHRLVTFGSFRGARLAGHCYQKLCAVCRRRRALFPAMI
jgi:hypothetical protein